MEFMTNKEFKEKMELYGRDKMRHQNGTTVEIFLTIDRYGIHVKVEGENWYNGFTAFDTEYIKYETLQLVMKQCETWKKYLAKYEIDTKIIASC